MKTWQRWQDAQTMLQKKREMEARLLWANKPDKLQQAKDEISEVRRAVLSEQHDRRCFELEGWVSLARLAKRRSQPLARPQGATKAAGGAALGPALCGFA